MMVDAGQRWVGESAATNMAARATKSAHKQIKQHMRDITFPNINFKIKEKQNNCQKKMMNEWIQENPHCTQGEAGKGEGRERGMKKEGIPAGVTPWPVPPASLSWWAR
jgi:hypothetical protein